MLETLISQLNPLNGWIFIIIGLGLIILTDKLGFLVLPFSAALIITGAIILWKPEIIITLLNTSDKMITGAVTKLESLIR